MYKWANVRSTHESKLKSTVLVNVG